MSQHNATRRNPYRKGSAFHPTQSQFERDVETYMDDHPHVSYDSVQELVKEGWKDWVEEHA